MACGHRHHSSCPREAPWPFSYTRATVLFAAGTVQDAYAEFDRLMVRLEQQGISPATVAWYVVDEEQRPLAQPGNRSVCGVWGASVPELTHIPWSRWGTR